jgi:RimJ/RimL family protein N-acetyltransferase
VSTDAEELHRMQSAPEMMRFLGGESPSVEKIRELIEVNSEKLRGTGLGIRATILRASGQMVGRCGLFYSEIEGKKQVELAYLIDRDYWGTGLATEAGRVLVDDGLKSFEKIMAVISPQNLASLRVAEKLGFEYQGRLSSHKDFGPVRLYSIDR